MKQFTPLSSSARLRLHWMEHLYKFRNARLTCRHFGISPTTLYRWKKRYKEDNPSSLEDDLQTRRPKNPQRPQWNDYDKSRIIDLQHILKKGRREIARQLTAEGHAYSPSTIGRILKYKKRD